MKDLRRYRLLILDESQNLRNKEGKKYKAIQEYIKDNDSKVILLSATPFNKNYLDLSSQLQLFVPNEMDLGIRPELLIGEIGEINFAKYQILPRSLAAFEKSEYPDDWRELMRLHKVRRTVLSSRRIMLQLITRQTVNTSFFRMGGVHISLTVIQKR